MQECPTVMLSQTALHTAPYMGKFWRGKRLVNLVNRELFAEIFLTNIHRYTKTVLAYALTVANLPIFSSPITFTCMVQSL